MFSHISNYPSTVSTKFIGDPPTEWSWDSLRPECSGSSTVRDQGACASGWAFSAVG